MNAREVFHVLVTRLVDVPLDQWVRLPLPLPFEGFMQDEDIPPVPPPLRYVEVRVTHDLPQDQWRVQLKTSDGEVGVLATPELWHQGMPMISSTLVDLAYTSGLVCGPVLW